MFYVVQQKLKIMNSVSVSELQKNYRHNVYIYMYILLQLTTCGVLRCLFLLHVWNNPKNCHILYKCMCKHTLEELPEIQATIPTIQLDYM